MAASSTRWAGRCHVLRILLKKPLVDRKGIISEIGVSHSTLSYITRELLSKQLIQVREISQKRGRPYQVLSLNPEAWNVIGIKMGREEVRGTLFDATIKPVKTRKIKIYSDLRSNEGYADAVQKILKELYCENLLGIGICSSGLVQKGEVVVSHLMGIKRFNLKEILRNTLNTGNILVMNDVDALAYAVLHSLNMEDTLVISYGTGIGASFCAKDRLHHFEIGHAVVANSGKCYCGQTGCLEYHASEYAVLKKYLKKEISFADFVEKEEEKYRAHIEQLRSEARTNFSDVYQYYRKAFHELSKLLGSIIMLLNPRHVIFLGEGMVSDQMVEALRKDIQLSYNTEFLGDVEFQLGHADWESGVALAVTHRFLSKVAKW